MMNKDKFKNLHENPVTRHLVVGGVILSIILILLFFTDYGIINRIKYEIDRSELADELLDEKQLSDSLNKKLKVLRNDTLEIERIAREKYGMVKDGEKVFFIKYEDE